MQYENACCPSTLAMILRHQGDSADELSIIQQHGVESPHSLLKTSATNVLANATIAAKLGYEVTAYTGNEALLGLNHESQNQYITRELVEKRLQHLVDADKIRMTVFKQALENRVKVFFVRPRTINQIKGFIDQGTPVHASVNTNLLYSTNEFAQTDGHSIALVAYNENEISYADSNTGGIHEIPTEQLRKAIESYAHTHSAYLIAITKGHTSTERKKN